MNSLQYHNQFNLALNQALLDWEVEVEQLSGNLKSILRNNSADRTIIKINLYKLKDRLTHSDDRIIACAAQRLQNLPLKRAEIEQSIQFLEENKLNIRYKAEKTVAKLQNFISQYEQEVHKNPISQKYQKLWLQFELPIEVLDFYPDCVEFLFKSQLIYSIVGFKNAYPNTEIGKGIHIDDLFHSPQILMEGKWTPWKKIQDKLIFDKDLDRIYSKDNPQELWMYLSPDGLVLKDRYKYDTLFPVHQLSEDEYHRLLNHASKFSYGGIQKGSQPFEVKDCVLQIFTTPSAPSLLKKIFGKEANHYSPSHYGIRLISKDRQVYSFGYGADRSEYPLRSKTSSYLMKVGGKVKMLDYDEFRPFERRVVTSIPLSSPQMRDIVNYLNKKAQSPLCFQYSQRNCTLLANKILSIAGYCLNIKESFKELLKTTFISPLEDKPFLKPIAKRIQRIARVLKKKIIPIIPKPIHRTATIMSKAIFFIPNIILNIAGNILGLSMGAHKSSPLIQKLEVDYPNKQKYKPLIRSVTDIFKKSPVELLSSTKLLRWQMKQGSTHIYEYDGKPIMCIVPPVSRKMKSV